MWLRKTPLRELPGIKASCLPLRKVKTGVISGPLMLAWPDLIKSGPVVVMRSVQNASFTIFFNICCRSSPTNQKSDLCALQEKLYHRSQRKTVCGRDNHAGAVCVCPRPNHLHPVRARIL